ncbi:MAG: RNA polymerase sigma factor RpoH [Burkholderiaceae bacterium]|jgi:RNA polymerase sigma-32 factor|nr:MAG: RNA polymerase sigma factor RpoH [Burkholderiaceae bacterium]
MHAKEGNSTMTHKKLNNAVALTRPWSAAVPSLGNLDAYITAVNRMPILTEEEEQRYARELREDGNLDSARRLILSHLRLVVSVSRQYLGYGLPHGDLIQEGNIGLMKAVKRFDPDQGVRLVSYALHWIKAEIHEYILKNWRLVKVATTKAQRKLFFNLRSMKQELKAEDAESASTFFDRDTLTEDQVNLVAQKLNVKPSEVREMETRLSGGDMLLDPTPADGNDDRAFGPIAYLSDDNDEPTAMLETAQRNKLATDGIAQALEGLDARSRRIVTERWLNVRDDGTGGMTLHELAAEYGVSAERIRQIEVAAMKKMKVALAQYA